MVFKCCRNGGTYIDPGDFADIPMLLDNVNCNGHETSLLDCRYIEHQGNCGPDEVAGVRCN